MLLYLTSNQKSNLIDPAVRNMTLPAKKLVGRFSLKSFVTKDMRNYANAKFFVVDAACIEESGIHPEDLPHIFKRFYRSRFSKNSQGVGLGLPLAKAIIESHSGTMEVDSELGVGTTFTINFLIPTKL